MVKVNVKPLSVNECWKGRKFKTPKYSTYEKEVILKLRKITIPIPPFRLVLEFGLSNKRSDVDNPAKPWIDIMQKKYLFNDKDIYELLLRKKIVKKGEEYVAFELTPLNG